MVAIPNETVSFLQTFRNMFSLWKSQKETDYVPFRCASALGKLQMIRFCRIMRIHSPANAHAHLLLTTLWGER